MENKIGWSYRIVYVTEKAFLLGMDGNGLSWLLNIMVVVVRERDKGGGLSWCILIVNRH